MYLEIIYLIYTHKKDLELNNQQWLICQKNKLNQTKNDWEKKNLHAEIDIVKTNRWLKSDELKAETKGLITGAQVLSQPTRNYRANIFKIGSNPICR